MYFSQVIFSCPGAAWSQILWDLAVVTFSDSWRRKNGCCGHWMRNNVWKVVFSPVIRTRHLFQGDFTWTFWRKSLQTSSGHPNGDAQGACLSGSNIHRGVSNRTKPRWACPSYIATFICRASSSSSSSSFMVLFHYELWTRNGKITYVFIDTGANSPKLKHQ